MDWPSLDRAGRFRWLTRLGNELMGDIEALIPGLPVAILCSVICEFDDQTFDAEDLRIRYDARLDAVHEAGCLVFLPKGSRLLGYGEALSMLRGRHILLRGKDGRFRSNPKDKALIDYYATSISQFLPDVRNRRMAKHAG